MNKTSLDFIDSIIESEYSCYKDWFEESILANRYWKNLFLVFPDKESLKKHMIYCCENKLFL